MYICMFTSRYNVYTSMFALSNSYVLTDAIKSSF